jgi:hypothetical protein
VRSVRVHAGRFLALACAPLVYPVAALFTSLFAAYSRVRARWAIDRLSATRLDRCRRGRGGCGGRHRCCRAPRDGRSDCGAGRVVRGKEARYVERLGQIGTGTRCHQTLDLACRSVSAEADHGDGVERCAQLMAHSRKELALGAIGLLRLCPRRRNGVVGVLALGDVACSRVDQAVLRYAAGFSVKPAIAVIARPITIAKAHRVRARLSQLSASAIVLARSSG